LETANELENSSFSSTDANLALPKPVSLLDFMQDGKEYASIISGVRRAHESNTNIIVDLDSDLKILLDDISEIRNRPYLLYVANMKVSSPYTSIDGVDDTPFDEMVRSIPAGHDKIDIIIVTPGGSLEKAARFVDILRSRFNNVSFILPYMCMSAGTVFCLSGDEIIMANTACIGPIDPQVRSKHGGWVPAQSIITLIDEINKRGRVELREGRKVSWSDVVLLQNMDAKEIGNAYNASKFSTSLVKEYLFRYKFKNWTIREHTGQKVTDEYKAKRANDIASMLCEHSKWLSHSREITREMAENELKLKITRPENIEGLDRAIRRLWALLTWWFEQSSITKIYFTKNYCLLKHDPSLLRTANTRKGGVDI